MIKKTGNLDEPSFHKSNQSGSGKKQTHNNFNENNISTSSVKIPPR